MSLDRRIEKLEAAASPIRYIVVRSTQEADAWHRWSASQEPYWGTTYIVITGVPAQEGTPPPPWMEMETEVNQ